jgi:hypothetical protein
MVALILFDTPANLPGTPGFDPSMPVSPGFFAGWQTVTHTVNPTDADHITSAGTNAFYKLTGELYRTGCSTAIGERFEYPSRRRTAAKNRSSGSRELVRNTKDRAVERLQLVGTQRAGQRLPEDSS